MVKLIGSRAEQGFRKELLVSQEALFHDIEKQRLLRILQTKFIDMITAYIIGWTPEQGEDIYLILINDNRIVKIELARYDFGSDPLVEIIEISDYKKGLSKVGQIKLAVALDLANHDLKSAEEDMKL